MVGVSAGPQEQQDGPGRVRPMLGSSNTIGRSSASDKSETMRTRPRQACRLLNGKPLFDPSPRDGRLAKAQSATNARNDYQSSNRRINPVR